MTRRRLWLTAGWLAIAHVVLLFAGVAFQHSLELGDEPAAATAALVGSSMTKNYIGGYLGFIGFLVFLVAGMLFARLLRTEGDTSAWLTSCISASAITNVAVTVATGFAAGGAALYDGHHGASLTTVTAVNDIRNFGFFLSGGVAGVFMLSVAGAALVGGFLPRWLAHAGLVVGVLSIAAVPAARLGLANATTMLWFVWFAALGVVSLRQGRRSTPAAPAAPAASPAMA